jgi:hypothetical protein
VLHLGRRLPNLVCGQGAVFTIAPELDDAERAALRRSASVIREAMASLRLT